MATEVQTAEIVKEPSYDALAVVDDDDEDDEIVDSSGAAPSADVIGLGLPLLQMSLLESECFIEQHGVQLNESICAGSEHAALFGYVQNSNDILFSPAGDVVTTLRVVQALNAEFPYSAAMVGSLGRDEASSTLTNCLEGEKIRCLFYQPPNVAGAVGRNSDDGGTGLKVAVTLKEAEVTGEEMLGRGRKYQGSSNTTVSSSTKVGEVVRTGAAHTYKHDHLRFTVWEHVERCNIVYSSSFFLGVSADSLTSVAESCHKSGQILCFNLACASLVHIWHRQLQCLLPFIEYLFGSEREFVQLATSLNLPCQEIEDVVQTISAQPKIGRASRVVICTRGDKPTLVASNWRGHGQKLATYPVRKITADDRKDVHVSLSGAGDAFAGGFVYSLLHDGDIDACLHLGHFAAREHILSSDKTTVSFKNEKPDVNVETMRKVVSRRRDSLLASGT